MTWCRSVLMTALLAGSLLAGDGWHTPPDKWTEPRPYHSDFELAFADRIELGRDLAPLAGAGDAERHASPNRAYSYTVLKSATLESGGTKTVVSIFHERDYQLQLTLEDDRRYGPRVAWINEKLLFIRAVWGRVLSTDLILDVEKEQIIYREMHHDGLIPYQQYQQAKQAGIRRNEDP